jgi:hypothetical protein
MITHPYPGSFTPADIAQLPGMQTEELGWLGIDEAYDPPGMTIIRGVENRFEPSVDAVALSLCPAWTGLLA